MHFFARLIFSLFSNLIALLAAVYFIPGFQITPGFSNFILVGAVLTLINAFIKPILKLLFMPIIFLTFGLGSLIINALMLLLLDKLLGNINIEGVLSLVYATPLITAVNLIINFVVKRTYKDNK